MNAYLGDNFFLGISTIIYIQVFILGIALLFFSKLKLRSLLLGAFCYILGSMTIYNLFWPYFKDSLFANILFGGQKGVLLPPILYLYVISIEPFKKLKNSLISHLILPFLFSTFYIVLKFGFSYYYLNNYSKINVFFNYLPAIIAIFYICYMILNKNIFNIILPSVRKKYIVFYFLILGSFLFQNLTSILGIYMSTLIKNFSILNLYIYSPLGFFQSFIIIAFVITENSYLKKFFNPKNPFFNNDIVNYENELKLFFQEKLIQEKLFKNVNLKLSDVAKQIDVTNNTISEYLRIYYKKSFNEFINDLRIEEFKTICNTANVSKLSISGIAFESGFKSKATFYRLFKEKEGISPGEYLKKDDNC